MSPRLLSAFKLTPRQQQVLELIQHAIADSGAPIFDDQQQITGAVLVFRDVTETRNLRHQISWHARHDALTGLYNRAALAEKGRCDLQIGRAHV